MANLDRVGSTAATSAVSSGTAAAGAQGPPHRCKDDRDALILLKAAAAMTRLLAREYPRRHRQRYPGGTFSRRRAVWPLSRRSGAADAAASERGPVMPAMDGAEADSRPRMGRRGSAPDRSRRSAGCVRGPGRAAG